MEQITISQAVQVHVVVENVWNLDAGWCLCICVCRFQVCSGGLVVFLYDTHEAESLARNWWISLSVGLTTQDATDTLS
jgi:hypothetical protein